MLQRNERVVVWLIKMDLLLTEAPETHEDCHVDCSPFHWDGRSGVKAKREQNEFMHPEYFLEFRDF